MVIKRFVNDGFKDLFRTVDLSGLDIFTSDDVNGTGKSAVLEGFKLALLGEIPGNAKMVDDVLAFTSNSEMRVSLIAETDVGAVTVERGFCRHAVKGEKRPIYINRVLRKFEDGDRWIRDHIGAVSVSFNPFEFLHLSDCKKRQWILEFSPESRFLSAQHLRVVLVARIMELHFGSTFIRSLSQGWGISTQERLFSCEAATLPEASLVVLSGYLAAAFRKHDEILSKEAEVLLDRIFSLWCGSLTAEQNIDVMLDCLKSEVSRLRSLLRETLGRRKKKECGAQDVGEISGDLTEKIRRIRSDIEILEEEIQAVFMRIQNRREVVSERKKIAARRHFLQTTLAGLASGIDDDPVDRLKEDIRALQTGVADTASLEDEVERLGEALQGHSKTKLQQEALCSAICNELGEAEKRFASLEASDIRCPLACEIVCTTDLTQFRGLLADKVRDLKIRASGELEKLNKTQAEFSECAERLEEARAELKNRLCANADLRSDIDRMKDQIAAEEKKRASARGMLKVYSRELASLVSESENENLQERVDEEALKSEMRELEEDRKKASGLLMEFLREQGRREAFLEARDKGKRSVKALQMAKLLANLLGPEGVQGELALRVSEALEGEVNRCLKMIRPDYDFSIDLSGKKFQMGWRRQGKLIPLTTINSAHFVLFIAPFLTAVINRLARVREKNGLPTLRALCIEAESLTPDNLVLLLNGLAGMRRAGLLDNILVAHYHSLRDPEKLCGFKEHILERQMQEAGRTRE